MSTWTKYWLFQVPGWVVAVIVLWALYSWMGLHPGIAAGLFFLWVLKDLALYPLLRIAYQSGPGTVVEQLVGLKGVAQETLDPAGYVHVRGELWRAAAEPSQAPVPAGSTVRIIRAQGMTLVVAPEKNAG